MASTPRIQEFVAEQLCSTARRLDTAMQAARTGDIEGVHQLRVALRRTRATLALFAPVMRRPARLDAELGWLGREVGKVRDLDVLAAAVAQRGRKLEPRWREALVPLSDHLRSARQTEHEVLVRELDELRARRIRTRLDSMIERASGQHPSDETLAARVPSLTAPLLADVLRGARAARQECTPSRLHALRVRVKRLRYALELLRDVDPALKKPIQRLVRLQERLGAHQDAVTQAAWLGRYGDDGAAPRHTLVVVGLLIAGLDRRARRMRRRIPTRLRRLIRQLPRRVTMALPPPQPAPRHRPRRDDLPPRTGATPAPPRRVLPSTWRTVASSDR